MAKSPRNMAASVMGRLLAHAKANHLGFELVLVRYALERLLFRLSQSDHADKFVLKGAMLLTSWFADPLRPTRDLDFLGYGDPAPDVMKALITDVMQTPVEDDGIRFDVAAIQIMLIREDVEYGGLRLRTSAYIDRTRIPVTIDIGFGDATEPGVELLDYPSLLDLPTPHIRGYARETVIAEKFQAITNLGMANTRIKDFYDILVLKRAFTFDQARLGGAIRATFARRGTDVPTEPPEALTSAFGTDAAKVALWKSFTQDLETQEEELDAVVSELRDFLMPFAAAAISETS